MTDLAPAAEYRPFRLFLCPKGGATCGRSLVRRADLAKRLAVIECTKCDYSRGWATFRREYATLLAEFANVPTFGAPIYGHDPKITSADYLEQHTFWTKVDLNGPTPKHRHDIGNCWTWTGSTMHGYGYYAGGLAHRHSWKLSWGTPPPEGAYICHRCDNPVCVRPTHLFLGNAALNTEDMVQKGRQIGGPNQPSKQR